MRKWLLFGIILLAFLLRTYDVYTYPPGFTPDEASFGYDAYSMLKTGKDQWGRSFPLVLESFGDFKPPLYTYILAPSVYVFGLNKFAVRFPNALLGTLAVFATYLMVKELFRNNRNWPLAGKERILAKTASTLLAISPWHVMLSRGGFEANLTTVLIPLAIYLFLKGLKKPQMLTLSAFVFGLNLFSYHSARVVTPLILLFLVFAFWKSVKRLDKKPLAISLLIFTSFFVLMAYTFSRGAGARVQDISVLSGALEEAAPQRLALINKGLSPNLARLVHNKYRIAAKRFISNYRQYFSLKFLFLDGPAEATYGMIPGRGVLYWFELPFLIGFVILFLKSKKKGLLFLIVGWLIISPIPAALAMGRGYAANRAATMIPAIQVVLALGAVSLHTFARRVLRPKLISYATAEYVFLSLIFFVFFIRDYFANPPLTSAKAMLSGNLEAAQWLKENASKTRQVIVSRKLSEPHIYVAFAHKWEPADYQKETEDWTRYRREGLLFLDQLGEYSLGNYTFSDIDMESSQEENVLLVGRPGEFPEDIGAMVIKTFYYPNREPAILIVDPGLEVYAKTN